MSEPSNAARFSLRTPGRSTSVALWCAVVVAGVAGCGGDPAGLPTSVASATPTRETPSVASDVATGLLNPWSIAFLPDGDALVSERNTGSIVLVDTDGRVTPVADVPGVVHGGEGGLLGLAVSPLFETDHLVYAYFTAASDNRIARMTYENGTLGAPEVILDGIVKSTVQNGGRIEFGPDGMLYAGTGDADDPGSAQDLGSLNGKILRMTPDGGIPPDNPFHSLVWSYGHSNVQGLGWAADGTMWADDLGRDRWDELNRIEPGGNYGWPLVEGQTAHDGMIEPVEQWLAADATPSGLAVVGDEVFLAGLRGQRLWRVVDPGSSGAPQPEAYLTGDYGRLRDVVAAPDGSLWVLTSNTDGRGSPRMGDDRILRVPRPT